MIAPLAHFIDRSILHIGYAMLPQSLWREAADERDLKLEQAVQFLNGPDFITAESQPAQLDFGPDAPGGRFRFATPRPCEFAENNVVHGGYTVAGTPGRKGRLSSCCMVAVTCPVISSHFTCSPAVATRRDSTWRPWNCLITFTAVHASMVR